MRWRRLPYMSEMGAMERWRYPGSFACTDVSLNFCTGRALCRPKAIPGDPFREATVLYPHTLYELRTAYLSLLVSLTELLRT